MAYTAPTFTTTATVNGNTKIQDVDEQVTQLVEDVTNYMNTEGGTAANLANTYADDAETSKNLSVNAQIASEAARDEAVSSKDTAVAKAAEIQGYVIPTDATYDAATIDKKVYDSVPYAQHGLIPTDGVNEIRPQDFFVEVDVADTLRLSDTAKTYKVRFTDGVYDINTADFALPKAPFTTDSTDELLASGVITQSNHSKGDIEVTGDTDTIYIALQDTTAGDLLSDTTKFKPIPYVTKQVALLVEKTSAGAILNTVKPLVNMYGEESVETYEADIFAELGYSQLADRVWTDGSSEFILLGLKTYLNDGAYHSWMNPLGSRNFSDNLPWYSTTDTVGGLYDCF